MVSLNPAVDAEWRVSTVVPGEKNEVTSERRWPGGKGINVARWLKWHGASPSLVLPLGGNSGRELASGLRAEGLPFVAVPIAQSTRVNVVVTPVVGAQLRFNPTWPVLSAGEVKRLMGSIVDSWSGCHAVVLSGSLVRGAPAETYATLIRRAGALELPVFLDCDGEAFRRGVRAGPTFVKPNAPELAEWAGRTLKTEAESCAAARELAAATGGWVLASRGEDGAYLVDGLSGWEAGAPAFRVRQVRNTVGAGDAMLAAVVATSAGDPIPSRWLTAGLRAAAFAVRLAPGCLPPR